MGEKQPRSDRWRRFWHWHGFEIVIILALAVGYAVFSFVPASPSSLDGSDRSSDSSAGYDFGYGRFYPRGWLSGYIDGYISQHPEINEYDLLDDILYTFPDVDTDDLIDYLRSAR